MNQSLPAIESPRQVLLGLPAPFEAVILTGKAFAHVFGSQDHHF
jgi:hypothetical protein